MQQYMSADQVCDLLKIAKSTLWRWERTIEGFPQPIKIGRTIRYSENDLHEYLVSQTQQGAQQ